MDSDGPIETIEARQRRLASVPRACEGCRIRKIRCDRTIPCSHCRASGISCQQNSDKPAPRSKFDRIKQLEAHVSRLESRLRGLEGKYDSSHTVSFHTIPGTKPGSHWPEANASAFETSTSPESGGNRLFEGETSFAYQSFRANEVVEKTARSDVWGDGSNVEESVDHLQRLLQDMASTHHHSFQSSTRKSLPKLKPLPPALVIGMLRRFKVRHPIFLSSYAVNDLTFVERLCRDVYFPISKITAGQVTAMHGILFSLMKEYKAMNDPLWQEYDLEVYLPQCEQNFVSGLEMYDVLAVPCFENVLALLLGALKAQEEGKPFLFCTLISSASTHCQTLGYHREITYRKLKSEEAVNARRLFWTVYVFDKNISLLIGRSSHIQDFEIDAEHPTPSSNHKLRPWDESFILGIKLATIQGQIYADLYSVAGLKKSATERSAIIAHLSSVLEQWHHDLKQIKSHGVNNPQIFDLTRGNWDITFYSTLTALFRVSPDPAGSGEISSQCFYAARLSLEAHLNSHPKYQESELLSDSDYINFVLLFSSFTPFIITFLHAIGTASLEDVKLLEDVVGTMRNAQAATKSTQKLFQICSAYVRLAKELIKLQSLPMSMYDSENDSIRWMNEQGESLLSLEIFQSSLGQDPAEGPSSSSALDILDNWISGQPLPMDFFDMDSEVDVLPLE